MRHEILCFQNLLSASLRPSPAGCTEETRGERRGPCDMSYDTLVAPWLGGHGWRDLSPGREPSTGFIRPKTIMNIFPSPVSINNGSPLISSPHVPCTILFRHTHAPGGRQGPVPGNSARAPAPPPPRQAGRGRSGLAASGAVAGQGPCPNLQGDGRGWRGDQLDGQGGESSLLETSGSSPRPGSAPRHAWTSAKRRPSPARSAPFLSWEAGQRSLCLV